jgi:hypothetical protein
MITLRSNLLAFVALTMLTALAALGCQPGDFISSPGAGFGIDSNPYGCNIGPLNQPWISARLLGNRTQPLKCPFKFIGAGTIAIAADLTGPKSTIDPNGYATLGPVNSVCDGLQVMAYQDRVWMQDPNVSNGWIAQFNQAYVPGYFNAGHGPWSHDSGTVTVIQTNYGQAKAFFTLSSGNQSFTGDLVLPTQVLAGAAATVRFRTAVDTNSYSFAWTVDGSPISGNDDADLTRTWSSPGTHTISSTATFQNGTETASATITVKLNISITGPSSVKQGCPAQWDAGVIGATAPNTYYWRLNGTHVGSNSSSYNATVNWTGSKSLSVDVTDNAGFNNSKSITVVGTSAGSCQA